VLKKTEEKLKEKEKREKEKKRNSQERCKICGDNWWTLNEAGEAIRCECSGGSRWVVDHLRRSGTRLDHELANKIEESLLEH